MGLTRLVERNIPVVAGFRPLRKPTRRLGLGKETEVDKQNGGVNEPSLISPGGWGGMEDPRGEKRQGTRHELKAMKPTRQPNMRGANRDKVLMEELTGDLPGLGTATEVSPLIEVQTTSTVRVAENGNFQETSVRRNAKITARKTLSTDPDTLDIINQQPHRTARRPAYLRDVICDQSRDITDGYPPKIVKNVRVLPTMEELTGDPPDSETAAEVPPLIDLQTTSTVRVTENGNFQETSVSSTTNLTAQITLSADRNSLETASQHPPRPTRRSTYQRDLIDDQIFTEDFTPLLRPCLEGTGSAQIQRHTHPATPVKEIAKMPKWELSAPRDNSKLTDLHDIVTPRAVLTKSNLTMLLRDWSEGRDLEDSKIEIKTESEAGYCAQTLLQWDRNQHRRQKTIPVITIQASPLLIQLAKTYKMSSQGEPPLISNDAGVTTTYQADINWLHDYLLQEEADEIASGVDSEPGTMQKLNSTAEIIELLDNLPTESEQTDFVNTEVPRDMPLFQAIVEGSAIADSSTDVVNPDVIQNIPLLLHDTLPVRYNNPIIVDKIQAPAKTEDDSEWIHHTTREAATEARGTGLTCQVCQHLSSNISNHKRHVMTHFVTYICGCDKAHYCKQVMGRHQQTAKQETAEGKVVNPLCLKKLYIVDALLFAQWKTKTRSQIPSYPVGSVLPPRRRSSTPIPDARQRIRNTYTIPKKPSPVPAIKQLADELRQEMRAIDQQIDTQLQAITTLAKQTNNTRDKLRKLGRLCTDL
jgi:hypothetical protein